MPKIAHKRVPSHTAGGVPVGTVVAVARGLLDLPSEDLAAAAGVSRYSLCRLERGLRAPAPGELPRLLALLGAFATGEDAAKAVAR